MLLKGPSPWHPDGPILVVNDIAGAPCPMCGSPLLLGVSRCWSCDAPLEPEAFSRPWAEPARAASLPPRARLGATIEALCKSEEAAKDRHGREVARTNSGRSWESYFQKKCLFRGLCCLSDELADAGPPADGATGGDLAGFLMRFEAPEYFTEEYGAESVARLLDVIRQLARWAADGFPESPNGASRI